MKNTVRITGDFSNVTAITIDGRNYNPEHVSNGSPIVAESGGSAFYIGTAPNANADCEIELTRESCGAITIENGNLNFG